MRIYCKKKTFPSLTTVLPLGLSLQCFGTAAVYWCQVLAQRCSIASLESKLLDEEKVRTEGDLSTRHHFDIVGLATERAFGL